MPVEEFPGPVAVIAGGLSHERDVSLASGRNLVRELSALGVEAHAYDFDRNLLHILERDKVVAVLPALHGQFGEDGEIQTLLELIGMPYVGSRSHSCRLSYDKANARELLRRDGIPVPDSVGLSAQTFRDIGAAALSLVLAVLPAAGVPESTPPSSARLAADGGFGMVLTSWFSGTKAKEMAMPLFVNRIRSMSATKTLGPAVPAASFHTRALTTPFLPSGHLSPFL